MAIIENVELWFVKVNPLRPNARFNPENPTWECQIRTTDKEQKKEWESMGLNVKPVIPEEGLPYYRVNLRKRKFKESGEASSTVDLVDAEMNPMDPDTIGNGSIGNIRIFQYEPPKRAPNMGLASILMGIQITKHIVFIQKPRDDDFKVQTKKTEVIPAEDMPNTSTPSPTPNVKEDF